MPSDEIGKSRSEAAIGARGVPAEAVGERKVGRLGGRAISVQDIRLPRGEGAGRAAMQIAGAVGSVAAAALTPFALTGAAIVGGATGGVEGAKRSAGKVIETGKEFYENVRDMTKPGDYGHLGQIAARGTAAVAAAPLLLVGMHPLGSQTFRESFTYGTGEILTEPTFQEIQNLTKAEKAAVGKTGYDKRDYKSVARFLKQMKAEGKTFTENGHLIYVDEANKKFLFAEMNADGNIVVKSARCMAVTRRKYGKDEPVSIREIYRYARAYALCYDELKESCSDLINKMDGEQLYNSVNNYLLKLDGKMRSIQDRKKLVDFLNKHNPDRLSDAEFEQLQEDRFNGLKAYFKRAGLSLGGEGVDDIHYNDEELEQRIKQEFETNNLPSFRIGGNLANYLVRHKLGTEDRAGALGHLETVGKDKVLAYIKAQDSRRKLVMDHLQARILEDTGFEMTDLTKADAALVAMDHKLARMAAQLCPNGVQELIDIKELADDPTTATDYSRKLGLRSEADVKQYLSLLQTRYQVKSNTRLSQKMDELIRQMGEIFVKSGSDNLQIQWDLIDARFVEGSIQSNEKKAALTEYLKREGIVDQKRKEAIQDFHPGQEPDINEARLKLHLQTLLERYGLGENRLNKLHVQKTFTECFENPTRTMQALEEQSANPGFRAYLQDNKLITNGEIDQEKAGAHFQALLDEYSVINVTGLLRAINPIIRLIETAQADPNSALRTKIGELLQSPEGRIRAAKTAQTNAQESIAYMMLLKEAWQQRQGSSTGLSADRLDRIKTLLIAKGAKIEGDGPIEWTEETIAVLNTALEEDADVTNTGGDEANLHVMQSLNNKIQEQMDILHGKTSGYDIQIQQHKEGLKERLAGENAVMNASLGTVTLQFRREYDPETKGWKKDAYNIEHKYKMSTGVKKSVEELWSDEKREIVPEFAAKPSKHRKN